MKAPPLSPTLAAHSHLFGATIRTPWLQVASFHPPTAGEQVLVPPGSKSLSNRAAILGALSRKTTTLEGFLFAEDTLWCLEALVQLGFGVEIHHPSQSVLIVPPSENHFPRHALHCGAAGTLARFLPALLVHWPSQTTAPGGFTLTGSAQLEKRPLAPLCHSLRQWGARVTGNQLPLSIAPSPLAGTTTAECSQSGQFASGLILAAAANPRPLTLQCRAPIVQPGYVHMTVQWAQKFGAPLQATPDLSTIHTTGAPGGLPGCPHIILEPDASTAAPFLTAAAIYGFGLTIKGLGTASSQPDAHFYKFLEQLGFVFSVGPHHIRVEPQRRTTPQNGSIEYSLGAMADQTPCAAVACLWAQESVVLTHIGHIRYHESNRIQLLLENFQGLGLSISQPSPSAIRVTPPASPRGLKGLWRTGSDHRFAMAGLVLAMGSPQVFVEEPQCVEKTVPDFCRRLELLGARLVPTNSPPFSP